MLRDYPPCSLLYCAPSCALNGLQRSARALPRPWSLVLWLLAHALRTRVLAPRVLRLGPMARAIRLTLADNAHVLPSAQIIFLLNENYIMKYIDFYTGMERGQLSEAVVQTLLDMCDKNGDGAIDYNEVPCPFDGHLCLAVRVCSPCTTMLPACIRLPTTARLSDLTSLARRRMPLLACPEHPW